MDLFLSLTKKEYKLLCSSLENEIEDRIGKAEEASDKDQELKAASLKEDIEWLKEIISKIHTKNNNK